MKIGVFVVIYKVVGNEWEKVEMSKKIKKGCFFVYFLLFLGFFWVYRRDDLDRNSDVELLVFKLVSFNSEVVDLLLHPGWCRVMYRNLDHRSCLNSGRDVELDRVGYGRGFGEDLFPIRLGGGGGVVLGACLFLLSFLALCPNPASGLLRVKNRASDAGMARQSTHSTAPTLPLLGRLFRWSSWLLWNRWWWRRAWSFGDHWLLLNGWRRRAWRFGDHWLLRRNGHKIKRIHRRGWIHHVLLVQRRYRFNGFVFK